MQLSRNEKVLAIAFAVMSICGILFTPVGLETRPLSALRSYALIPLFLSGTILDLAVGITINEVVALIASIVVFLIAPMVYLANRKSSKPLP